MRTCLIFATVGLGLVATPVIAQQSPPPPPSPEAAAAATRADARFRARTNYNRDFGSKVMLKNEAASRGYSAAIKVAACLAKKAKTEAGALLGGPLTSDPNYDKLTKALSRKFDTCVTADAVGLSMNVINGALAEQLVRYEKPTLDDRAKLLDAKVAHAFYTDPNGKTIDSVGRCLAAYSPGLAYRVLAATAGSPEENSALTALYSQSPECGVTRVPEGFTPQDQRSVLATGLYYWTHRS